MSTERISVYCLCACGEVSIAAIYSVQVLYTVVVCSTFNVLSFALTSIPLNLGYAQGC